MSRFRDKDAGGVCKPLLITVDPKSQPASRPSCKPVFQNFQLARPP